MAKYFKKIDSKEKADELYRDLAKQLHPDAGGSTEEFQEMNSEYKELLIALKWRKEIIPQEPTGAKKAKAKISQATQEKLIKSAGELAAGAMETLMQVMLSRVSS